MEVRKEMASKYESETGSFLVGTGHHTGSVLASPKPEEGNIPSAARLHRVSSVHGKLLETFAKKKKK